MLLNRIAIRNLRSLEDVELNETGNANILIGRNNSGKSTVLAALAAAAESVTGRSAGQQSINWSTASTNLDNTREISIELDFRTSDAERDSFLEVVLSQDVPNDRTNEIRTSAFGREVRFRLSDIGRKGQAPVLTKYWIRGEIDPPADWPLVLDGNRVADVNASIRAWMNQPISNQTMDASNGPGTNYPNGFGVAATGPLNFQNSGLWPHRLLTKYFASSFFFDPIRRSQRDMNVQQHLRLDPDGSNLAGLLNTLQANVRATFDRVDSAMKMAVPELERFRHRCEGIPPLSSFLTLLAIFRSSFIVWAGELSNC